MSNKQKILLEIKEVKKDNLNFYKSPDFRAYASMYMPDVPVRDTSVKTLMETSQPVLPMEEQYYDNDTPIHIYKSFDFKNMPMDPSALHHARSFVAPQAQPAAPVIQQSVTNQPDNVIV